MTHTCCKATSSASSKDIQFSFKFGTPEKEIAFSISVRFIFFAILATIAALNFDAISNGVSSVIDSLLNFGQDAPPLLSVFLFIVVLLIIFSRPLRDLAITALAIATIFYLAYGAEGLSNKIERLHNNVSEFYTTKVAQSEAQNHTTETEDAPLSEQQPFPTAPSLDF